MSKRKANTPASPATAKKGKSEESKLSPEERAIADDFLRFVNKGVTQFHAVEQAKMLLRDAGYSELSEKEPDLAARVQPNGRYFISRNQSGLVAFAVGGKFKPGNGFVIIGAHTDSPVPKVKPISKISKQGFLQVGIELYGGGLWNTWFDRDISVAGRVIVKAGAKFEARLVRIEKPILRIPNLAIHLNKAISTDGFKFNNETETVPLLATTLKAGLEAKEGKEKGGDHHSALIEEVASELGVAAGDIVDFELCLYDTQPAQLSGLYDEFIVARGLDNLMMSFVSLRSLIDADGLAEDSQIRMIGLFDNEEIGSNSLMGAGSNWLPRVLQQLNNDDKSYDSAIRKSFLISADMAHACHPNYVGKHEDNHRPAMHKGLVLKNNCNQRYATNSTSAFLLQTVATRHDIPIQKFVVRNDSGCGSTIGPILASSTGIRTADVGIPQLAMHSVREMCGTADVESTYRLFKAFYKEFAALDQSLTGSD